MRRSVLSACSTASEIASREECSRQVNADKTLRALRDEKIAKLTKERNEAIAEAAAAQARLDAVAELERKANAFVLVVGFDYEGYNAPVGIYSTLAQAQAAKAKLLGDENCSRYDKVEILGYAIDTDLGYFEV